VSARLFVAVDIDEPAREFIASAIEQLKAAGIDERFTTRERWHATLAFLGPVAQPRYDAVIEAVEAAAAACAPFDLVLDGVGAFPNQNRPRVVWVGSSGPQPLFVACAGSVRRALGTAGFRFDDEAVPHVTVCRIKRPATALPPTTLNRSVSVRVDALSLYESVAAGQTTAYNVIRRAALGEIRKGHHA
jgi:2'-5' RNA ligase